jgi:hypothetical protein
MLRETLTTAQKETIKMKAKDNDDDDDDASYIVLLHLDIIT